MRTTALVAVVVSVDAVELLIRLDAFLPHRVLQEQQGDQARVLTLSGADPV